MSASNYTDKETHLVSRWRKLIIENRLSQKFRLGMIPSRHFEHHKHLLTQALYKVHQLERVPKDVYLGLEIIL